MGYTRAAPASRGCESKQQAAGCEAEEVRRARAGAVEHSAPLPRHALRHVSNVAPELGVHKSYKTRTGQPNALLTMITWSGQDALTFPCIDLFFHVFSVKLSSLLVRERLAFGILILHLLPMDIEAVVATAA